MSETPKRDIEELPSVPFDSDEAVYLFSIAISLKRIADTLDEFVAKWEVHLP